MRTIVLLYLCIFFSTNVYSQDSSLVAKLTYDSRIEEAIQYQILDSLKKPLDGFFKTLGESLESEHWDQADQKIYSTPFIYLLQLPMMMESVKFHPFVMSITPEEDHYLCKIAYLKCDSTASIEKIYYVGIAKTASGDYKLKKPTSYLTKDWPQHKVGSINYVVNPKMKFDQGEAIKMDSFNKYIASFFHTETIIPKYYSCENIYDWGYVEGEDNYYMTGFYLNTSGGRAVPGDNIIYSANNSQYYPHELVHLYVGKFQPDLNHSNFSLLSVEGIPTFLGGSEGVDLNFHLRRVAKYKKDNKIKTLDELRSIEGGAIGDTLYTKIDYAIGGLIAQLINKKSGYKGIIKLCDAHDDKEVLDLLAKTYKLKNNEVELFILKELMKYE